MNSPFRMLAWHELRQRRAQFAFALVWMVCSAAYALAYEWSRGFRAPVAGFFTGSGLFALGAPIFLAMRTSLGEISDRTRSFSDGLPISPRSRGWTRLIGGACVLVVPIAVGAGLLSLFLALGWVEQVPARPGFGVDFVPLLDRASLNPLSAVGLLWSVTAIVACWGLCLYVILSLLGTTLRAESHLGFAGAAVAFLWLLGGDLMRVFEAQFPPRIAAWTGAILPQSLIVNFGYGDERGGYGDLHLASRIFGPLLVNVLLQFALAVLFVRRYGHRLSGRAIRSNAQVSRRTWWPQWTSRWTPRLPSRGVALAWLALRQSVPMCLPGLAIAAVMALFQMDTGHPAGQEAQGYIDALPASMWIVGLLWAVVVGAGIFSTELDRRIGEFWQTRPIGASRLFAVKFVIGLAAVLLVLDVSTIAATWYSPNWGTERSMNWAYIACFLPLHATMFAVAVAWTCILRRPVWGGMAAIATFTLLSVALDWSTATHNSGPIEVYNELAYSQRAVDEAIDFTAHGYPLVATAMGLIFIAATLVGIWAIGRYSPRHSV